MWEDLQTAMKSSAEHPGFIYHRNERLLTLYSKELGEPLSQTNVDTEDDCVPSICMTFDSPGGKILTINAWWPRIATTIQKRLLSGYMELCKEHIELYGDSICLLAIVSDIFIAS